MATSPGVHRNLGGPRPASKKRGGAFKGFLGFRVLFLGGGGGDFNFKGFLGFSGLLLLRGGFGVQGSGFRP